MNVAVAYGLAIIALILFWIFLQWYLGGRE